MKKSWSNKVSQQGIIDAGLSYFVQEKYLTNPFEETLINKYKFLNKEPFSDATEVYDNFFQKIMVAINKAEPIKESMKLNSQGCFDGRISESI